MRPDKIKSSIKIWQLNFLSKKIDSCERSLFVLNYLKTFKAVRKNNQRTHSPQHNKKSCVDDSYLFLGLYSRKVAGRVIALGLPSFTKSDVSALKQIKLTAPLILHIRIGSSTKFQRKLIILIFWTKFAQGVFPVENGKSHLYVRPQFLLTIFKLFRIRAFR